MLDELACLTRDLLVMKTAPGTGITMLSGVASDSEVKHLTDCFSSGELVRMMTLLQQTMAGFTRSSSRRMDAELCLIDLCQPELSLDAQSLNARLTRIEDQLKSGTLTVNVQPQKKAEPQPEEDDDRPPMPGDEDAPPSEEEGAPVKTPAANTQAPAGFWTDLMTASRKELKPPASGFFVAAQNSPLRGALKGDTLELRCAVTFVADTVNKPDILEVVSRKASAMLCRSIRAVVVDMNARPAGNPRMEQLMRFGREHSDIINIKNN